MKFGPGKAWQYPVLRPRHYGDDYPQAEFEVDIELTRTENSTASSLRAEFFLSDLNLSALVENGSAKYVLLVSSSKTRFRKALESAETKIEENFTAGELSGRVDFSAFLIATCPTKAADWNGWHNDFNGFKFEIETGSVLAVEEPKSYWIDRADERPLGSIFVHKPSSDLQNERWTVNLEAERVEILMSQEVSDLYKSVRERIKDEMDVQYLMNSLYLPALIKVLYEADRNAEDYEEYRWFSALDNLLDNQECHKLGSQKADRSSDAQKLLQLPFAKILRLLNQENNE